MGLDRRLPAEKTVGDIYAWSAAGKVVTSGAAWVPDIIGIVEIEATGLEPATCLQIHSVAWLSAFWLLLTGL